MPASFVSQKSSESSQTKNNQPSRTQVTQLSKIRTVITDRNDPEFDDEPPKFTRTDSYYQTGVTSESGYKHLKASDVRRQVSEAPPGFRTTGNYPRQYYNEPYQPLKTQPPWKEYPIVPSPQNGSGPSNYRGGRPGPVRAFYNENDQAEFDVGYHDDTSAPRGPRNGRPHANTNYSLASYHPAPTYTDTSTLRRS